MVRTVITAMRFEMNSTKDAMMPQSKIEKESVPGAEVIEPLPETETERQRRSETYSEGGLSGEAAVVGGTTPKKTAALDVTLDTEPFMLRQHTDEEVADYDDGFKAGFKGRPNDDGKSQAWQRGWAEAQEWRFFYLKILLENAKDVGVKCCPSPVGGRGRATRCCG
jgi:hypothetical protein